MSKKIIGVLISVALLSACAGKTLTPIPQPQCCNDTKQKPKDNKTKTTHHIPKEFIR
ncbi:MAG: hypothetical protein WAL30_06180 [Candidatus Aquirickettsiella sp.]